MEVLGLKGHLYLHKRKSKGALLAFLSLRNIEEGSFMKEKVST